MLACSHEKDENVFVGALRCVGKELVPCRTLAGFVEIPPVTVRFAVEHDGA